jgi:predicted DNA binding CopG/RHH family protein
LGPATGEREKKRMKKKNRYTDGPIGRYKIIKDFLPSPDQLVKKESNIKVTINLGKESVDFFKSIAKRNRVKYQRVIRSLLTSYSDNFTHKI